MALLLSFDFRVVVNFEGLRVTWMIRVVMSFCRTKFYILRSASICSRVSWTDLFLGNDSILVHGSAAFVTPVFVVSTPLDFSFWMRAARLESPYLTLFGKIFSCSTQRFQSKMVTVCQSLEISAVLFIGRHVHSMFSAALSAQHAVLFLAKAFTERFIRTVRIE